MSTTVDPDELNADLLEDMLDIETEWSLGECGISLHHMSLTTAGWLKRAGCSLIEGRIPLLPADENGKAAVDETAMFDNLGMFLLAHDTRRTVRENAILFRGASTPEGKARLSEEIDEILASVKVRDVQAIVSRIVEYIVNEMKSQVKPAENRTEENVPGN